MNCYSHFNGKKEECKSCELLKHCIESTDLDNSISKHEKNYEYIDSMLQEDFEYGTNSEMDFLLAMFFEESLIRGKFSIIKFQSLILRFAGLTYANIAKILDKPIQTIHNYCNKIQNNNLKNELINQDIIFSELNSVTGKYLRGLE